MTKTEGETDLSGLFDIFLKRGNIPHKRSVEDPGFLQRGFDEKGTPKAAFKTWEM